MRRTSGGRRAAAAVAVVLGVLVVAGACGSSGSDSEPASAGDSGGGVALSRSGTVAEDAADGDTAAEPAPANGSSGGADQAGGTANRPRVSTRAVIRHGEISIVTREINRARLQVDDLLGRYGGYLASEDTRNDAKGRPERSALVLRVPEPAFDDVMDDLGRIGRTRQADRSSEDVTTKLLDVESRVATQEASLARLQRFLRQAENVEDMIRLESEIAERQADLESLQAQQKYLRDNTAMSTVTVHLSTPSAPPPAAEPRDAGFLAGLEEGWTALRTVLVGLATVAGAVLPFALALSVVVVPAWLLVRASRRRRPVPPVEQPDAG